jgi:hypothetical protein
MDDDFYFDIHPHNSNKSTTDFFSQFNQSQPNMTDSTISPISDSDETVSNIQLPRNESRRIHDDKKYVKIADVKRPVFAVLSEPFNGQVEGENLNEGE